MTVYVVGTDGSETAARAADRAGELAQATGAAVHVVCAYTSRGTTTIKSGSDTFFVSALTDAEDIAAKQASALRAGGVTVTVAALDGKPAAIILDEAKRVNADLIVVGNRRMQGVQRILGAVANDIVHHADCDVLVVKTV
jgi:nucleotide-binding universal stress UspA family protein